MKFDFDAAYLSFKSQPEVQKWMDLNKPQLIALTGEKIIEIVMAYVNGGDSAVAITSALSLDEQAGAMVTGSADVTNRRYEAGQRMIAMGQLGLKIVVMVIMAGVGL